MHDYFKFRKELVLYKQCIRLYNVFTVLRHRYRQMRFWVVLFLDLLRVATVFEMSFDTSFSFNISLVLLQNVFIVE